MRRLLVIGALLVAACHRTDTNQLNSADKNDAIAKPKQVDGSYFGSGDAVLQLLQQRVVSAAQGAQNFQVQSLQDSTFIYPVGTLLVPGRTIADDRVVCAPKTPVGDFDMPSVFNSISMSGQAAFDLGLTRAVTELANVGVKAQQNDVFKLSVTDPKGEFLLDHELSQALDQPDCQKYLQGKTMNFVRGYIIGERSYVLDRGRQASGSIGVSSIGNLKVEANGDNTVSLADDHPTKFLQIVSQVTVAAAAAPPPPPPPPFPGQGHPAPQFHHVPAEALTALVRAPVAPPGPGLVYLQRDVADTSPHANEVKSLLAQLSLNVVPKVEAIESDKMPRVAQVRYFNKEDEGLADRALAPLRKIFPDASKLYVGLKAPPGQLEVWLPKTGG